MSIENNTEIYDWNKADLDDLSAVSSSARLVAPFAPVPPSPNPDKRQEELELPAWITPVTVAEDGAMTKMKGISTGTLLRSLAYYPSITFFNMKIFDFTTEASLIGSTFVAALCVSRSEFFDESF